MKYIYIYTFWNLLKNKRPKLGDEIYNKYMRFWK